MHLNHTHAVWYSYQPGRYIVSTLYLLYPKDKLRFFAGVYFLYRVLAFLAYMHSETVPPVLLALLILGIHSVTQPYKSWKHNVINGLIFLDIAIINSITNMIAFLLVKDNTRNVSNLKREGGV